MVLPGAGRFPLLAEWKLLSTAYPNHIATFSLACRKEITDHTPFLRFPCLQGGNYSLMTDDERNRRFPLFAGRSVGFVSSVAIAADLFCAANPAAESLKHEKSRTSYRSAWCGKHDLNCPGHRNSPKQRHYQHRFFEAHHTLLPVYFSAS